MSRIILALDNMDMSRAIKLTRQTQGVVWGVKANALLLAHQAGSADCISLLKHYGARVFADPKFHDIPQTVANGVAILAKQGADLITVHPSGGPEMVRAAVETYATHRPENGLGILAVTLLTSIDVERCKKYYRRTPEETVLMFAEEAAEAGVYGFVCSPKELAILDGKFPGQKRVTPGVRSPGAQTHDQQRIDTPLNAVKKGADLFVVGREVTQTADPEAVCRQINADVELYR
jgi:orotidine-5'-phosphate decarboxylase